LELGPVLELGLELAPVPVPVLVLVLVLGPERGPERGLAPEPPEHKPPIKASLPELA
jgi:hypothetical protein